MEITANLGAKILLYILIIPLLLFYGLLMGGCVSTAPAIPQLGLVQIQIDLTTIIAVGYYGMCVFDINGVSCVPVAFKNATQIKDSLKNAAKFEIAPKALDAIDAAYALQTKVYLNVFSIAAVAFVLSLLFELLRFRSVNRKRKGEMTGAAKRRQNFVRQVSLGLVWSACGLTLAAATANTQTANALQNRLNNAITPGQLSYRLHWTAWALSVLYASGLTILHRGRSSA